MILEQLNIKIAEACGWRIASRVASDAKPFACMCWIRPGGDEWHEERIPNYASDLNAMHEAEKVLTFEQFCLYANNLIVATGRVPDGDRSPEQHARGITSARGFHSGER